MKYLPMILLLATCPACTVGYQGLLDEADINPNVATSPDTGTATSPDTGTATHPDASAIDAMSPDAQTDPDAKPEIDAIATTDARDAACVPITTPCVAVKPSCFTDVDDGCGGLIACTLSKDCYPNVPDGAVACVVSACPTDCGQNSVPCCSMTTYGACGCTFGAAGTTTCFP